MDGPYERRCLIALHLTPGLGPRRIVRLVQVLGSAAGAWNASAAVLVGVPGIGSGLAALLVRGHHDVDVDRELRRAEAARARLLYVARSRIPARLRSLHDAPPVVYLRGTWGGGLGPAVAVVGTRRASAYGLGIARVLGETLGTAGVTVVSGLARGIDRAAHAGPLRAEGVTVGVLGCGVDVAYPAEHHSLIEEMQKRGGVMAETPMGTRPRAQQFPPDDVTVRTGLDSAAVAVALAGLEVRGLVRQRPGKNFLRRPSLPHTAREDAGGTTWPNHSSL